MTDTPADIFASEIAPDGAAEPKPAPLKLDAAAVKAALRARHPALDAFGGPGPWTCVEEWMNIDLLAVAAWASVKPYPRYGRVGYEVKVSRADYRRELAKPYKRKAAVAFCHEFYFAVPHGLLKPEEVTWAPPEGLDQAASPFERHRCYGLCGAFCNDGRLYGFGAVDPRSPRDLHTGRGRHEHRIDYSRAYYPVCPVCGGLGWIAESPAVRAAAPYLWIPEDVGLVVVYPTGRAVIAKKAPRREPGRRHSGETSLLGPLVQERKRMVELSDQQLADLVRWVSFRPDPRHVEARARRNGGSGLLSPE